MVMLDVIIVAEANIINVPQEHKSIQAALKVAKVGDTILVAPGIYRGELSLKDGVILQGIVEKPNLKLVVKAINVKGAVITNFAMKGGTNNDHFGIFCRNAKVTIKDVTIWGFHHGISARSLKLL